MLLLTGRPSDDPLDVDFVPSVFAYQPNTRKHVVNTKTATTSFQNCFTQTCTVTSKQRRIQVHPKIASAGIQTDFVEHRCFSASCMENNDSMTMFYTGLSSWKVFEHVFSILLPHIPRKWSPRSKLTPKDDFF